MQRARCARCMGVTLSCAHAILAQPTEPQPRGDNTVLHCALPSSFMMNFHLPGGRNRVANAGIRLPQGPGVKRRECQDGAHTAALTQIITNTREQRQRNRVLARMGGSKDTPGSTSFSCQSSMVWRQGRWRRLF